MNFVCGACQHGNHDVCDSLFVSGKGDETWIKPRPKPSPTHCDCQHRTEAKSVIKS